jgi:hypothetical protein
MPKPGTGAASLGVPLPGWVCRSARLLPSSPTALSLYGVGVGAKRIIAPPRRSRWGVSSGPGSLPYLPRRLGPRLGKPRRGVWSGGATEFGDCRPREAIGPGPRGVAPAGPLPWAVDGDVLPAVPRTRPHLAGVGTRRQEDLLLLSRNRGLPSLRRKCPRAPRGLGGHDTSGT